MGAHQGLECVPLDLTYIVYVEAVEEAKKIRVRGGGACGAGKDAAAYRS
jgi:hypothetical protein